jgi:hypothetical protein
MISATGLGALTPQQREIIELAAQGLSNREIAQRLLLSPAPPLPTCAGPFPSSAWQDDASSTP